MTEAQKEISKAFDLISAIQVSGQDVDKMAIAREHLRTAFKLTAETEPEKDETEGQKNGR